MFLTSSAFFLIISSLCVSAIIHFINFLWRIISLPQSPSIFSLSYFLGLIVLKNSYMLSPQETLLPENCSVFVSLSLYLKSPHKSADIVHLKSLLSLHNLPCTLSFCPLFCLFFHPPLHITPYICLVHLSIFHILVECPTYSVPHARFYPSWHQCLPMSVCLFSSLSHLLLALWLFLHFWECQALYLIFNVAFSSAAI